MTQSQQAVTHGLLEVVTPGASTVAGNTVTVAFDDAPFECVINGTPHRAESATGLAASIHDATSANLLPLPVVATAAGNTISIAQPDSLFSDNAGAHLIGSAVSDAIAKAEALAPLAPGSWLPGVEIGDVERKLLESLVAGDRWDGPLVVSMPRTGSTLLGMLFLLLRDPPGHGDYAFDRYIHEPAAPLFWQGRSVTSIDEIITEPLTSHDVIQESAYQFANRSLARWFIRQARRPIIFAVRHPQLSWPSRWRILLSMQLQQDPEGADAERIRSALAEDDFTGVGDLLAATTPPDNGWLAMLSLIEYCIQDGIDFTIVDNARFRADPDEVLRQLCERLSLPFDGGLTNWSDLAEVRERVVMGELAKGDEYDHYYRQTLDSSEGIVREDRPLVPLARIPAEVRSSGVATVTIEEAVTWYHLAIARPEAIRV